MVNKSLCRRSYNRSPLFSLRQRLFCVRIYLGDWKQRVRRANGETYDNSLYTSFYLNSLAITFIFRIVWRYLIEKYCRMDRMSATESTRKGERKILSVENKREQRRWQRTIDKCDFARICVNTMPIEIVSCSHPHMSCECVPFKLNRAHVEKYIFLYITLNSCSFRHSHGYADACQILLTSRSSRDRVEHVCIRAILTAHSSAILYL